MRIASLGSGSKGNATLVDTGETLLLIDCGLTRKEAEDHLAQSGRAEDGDLRDSGVRTWRGLQVLAGGAREGRRPRDTALSRSQQG